MKVLWISTEGFYGPKLWRSLITRAIDPVTGKVYRHHFCVDRTISTGSMIPIFKFDVSNYIMPILKESNITLERCISNRCEDIFNRTNKKIIFMYSGGKDSTCALVGFIKNFGLKECRERIIICANKNSIDSNFEFYRDYIYNQFEIISSNNCNYTLAEDYYKDNLIVNGDPANVFDGGMLLPYIMQLGIDIGSKHWKDVIRKHHATLFFNYEDLDCYSYLIDIIETTSANRGFKIETVFDFVWWYKHNFHWMVECLNMLKNFSPMLIKFNYGKKYWYNKFIPFFDTDDFVLWSYNDRENNLKQKLRNNSPKTYKLPFKQFMGDIITDQKFLTELDTGTLSPNLNKNIKQFYLLNENYEPTFFNNN